MASKIYGASDAPRQTRLTQLMAAGVKAVTGRTREMSLASHASAAVRVRPVTMRSFASVRPCGPARRASRCVPPQPVKIPNAAPRCANSASALASRAWQASAKSNPPPIQYPRIAATTGLRLDSTAHMADCPSSANLMAAGPWSSAISESSAPAEKHTSWPQITAPCNAASDCNRRIASHSARKTLRLSRGNPLGSCNSRKRIESREETEREEASVAGTRFSRVARYARVRRKRYSAWKFPAEKSRRCPLFSGLEYPLPE